MQPWAGEACKNCWRYGVRSKETLRAANKVNNSAYDFMQHCHAKKQGERRKDSHEYEASWTNPPIQITRFW